VKNRSFQANKGIKLDVNLLYHVMQVEMTDEQKEETTRLLSTEVSDTASQITLQLGFLSLITNH
jgi:hypothetical protein